MGSSCAEVQNLLERPNKLGERAGDDEGRDWKMRGDEGRLRERCRTLGGNSGENPGRQER